MPQEWKKGFIIKLSKEGDISDCQKRTGNQLLSLHSNVPTRQILERIRTEADSKLIEEQVRFLAGKSCTDQIATLRIIIEQSLEWQ